MASVKKKAVLLGCGYLGEFVARELARKGWTVHAVRRNWAQIPFSEIEKPNIHCHAWDIHEQYPGPGLPKDPTVVLNFLSAGGQGLAGYRRNYLESQERIADWLRQLPKPPEHYLFTSSSRVYPQDGDVWVEEGDAPDFLPDDEAGDLLRQGEKAIFAWPENLVLQRTILRITGIYGPGRSFLLRQLQSGGGYVREHCQHYLNLIRVEDIVAAVSIVLEKPPEGTGKIYNLSDGNPFRKEEILRWLARQCGCESNLWVGPSSPRVSRRGRVGPRASRRINAGKIRKETGWYPRYPCFEQGFQDLF
ncbi:MAG: NAD-dependent epimerase/dehydratase family protein [Opitutales bacterium]|nr:NAD-dependent epimerase/dehydratase family protein [Opitutales bacterium]MCH8539820.1 NAD-dependent epimerase/dehydratase family protein [Opitutales bacterium]